MDVSRDPFNELSAPLCAEIIRRMTFVKMRPRIMLVPLNDGVMAVIADNYHFILWNAIEAIGGRLGKRFFVAAAFVECAIAFGTDESFSHGTFLTHSSRAMICPIRFHRSPTAISEPSEA